MKIEDEIIFIPLQFNGFSDYSGTMKTEFGKSKEIVLNHDRGIEFQKERIIIPAELIEKLHREIEIINHQSYICKQWAEYCEFVLELEEVPELDPETIRKLSANEVDSMREMGCDYDTRGLWSCFRSISEDLGLKEKEEYDL
ncbi:MAG: hypothetical protein IKO10_03315 [Lachnospiraceae bacterium]|nr:hypothetical protein [Lachnospiraceae bacterium]